MEDQKEIKQNDNDHLANERTLLAWVRTSIGVMTFGFVVVKFSLFIKQLSVMLGRDLKLPENGLTTLIGILLVGAGSVSLLLSFFSYWSTKKQLDEGRYSHSPALIMLLVGFVFGASLLLIFYLIKSAITDI